MVHQNDILRLLSQILGILSTKERKVDWSSAALVGCIALTFWSSSSHTSSIGFKSADCTSQDISQRRCCSFLFLMYLWKSLLIGFQSLSYMCINPWATSCIPDVIKWCCSMLWLAVWFNLLFTWCKSQNQQLVKDPYTITEPRPCFMVGIQGVVALSPSLW